MLPLVGDLTPPAHRGTALSIVSSGLVLGLLFARLLAGIIAEYSYWRNIYWLALGLQYVIFCLLWLAMPDYPSTNTDISYFKVLYSIFGLFLRHPALVQATLIGFLISSVFTSFWTTLTFLLSGSPYNYSTVIIGLFAIAGLTPMFLSPIYSRLIIDNYVTYVSVTISLAITIAGISIGTYTGTFTVAGPILQACLLDFGLQATIIANRVSIFTIDAKARNRINTGYMVGSFCGQLMGTSVGNTLYARAGWVGSGSASLGFVALALMVCLSRGPKEDGWVGWTGGNQFRRVHAEEDPHPAQGEK
jgi:predicted MFS family arabinose efflux permease